MLDWHQFNTRAILTPQFSWNVSEMPKGKPDAFAFCVCRVMQKSTWQRCVNFPRKLAMLPHWHCVFQFTPSINMQYNQIPCNVIIYVIIEWFWLHSARECQLSYPGTGLTPHIPVHMHFSFLYFLWCSAANYNSHPQNVYFWRQKFGALIQHRFKWNVQHLCMCLLD